MIQVKVKKDIYGRYEVKNMIPEDLIALQDAMEIFCENVNVIAGATWEDKAELEYIKNRVEPLLKRVKEVLK